MSTSQERAYLKKGKHHVELVYYTAVDKFCEQNFLLMPFRKSYLLPRMSLLSQHTPSPRTGQVFHHYTARAKGNAIKVNILGKSLWRGNKMIHKRLDIPACGNEGAQNFKKLRILWDNKVLHKKKGKKKKACVPPFRRGDGEKLTLPRQVNLFSLCHQNNVLSHSSSGCMLEGWGLSPLFGSETWHTVPVTPGRNMFASIKPKWILYHNLSSLYCISLQRLKKGTFRTGHALFVHLKAQSTQTEELNSLYMTVT